jgi:hypothetical protein
MCLGGVGRAGGDAGQELGMKGLALISTRLAHAANLYISIINILNKLYFTCAAPPMALTLVNS